ncbi:MAG: DUF5677 domain-containing protein [Sideroxydans sp.]|nr:DUF5677 domain-containing protein [Sideroxydans sp.]
MNSVIAAAEKIAMAARQLIDSMRPSKVSPDRLKAALFLAIAEQFEASLQLARLGMASHASVHVRSMLEGLVYMHMLSKDGKYVEQMKYNQLRSEKKVYESLLKDVNLPAEYRLILQARMDECKPRFETMYANGMRPGKITDDIVAAGLSDLSVPYSMLCGFSHHDLSVLALRHQGDNAMTYMAPDSPDVVELIFSIAIRVIVVAAESMSKSAWFPEGVFEAAFQDMNNAWGGAMNEAGGTL